MSEPIQCICDRDDCRACWAARMDDTAEIAVVPIIHDAVIDPVDVPLIVPTPHGYEEPCS